MYIPVFRDSINNRKFIVHTKNTVLSLFASTMTDLYELSIHKFDDIEMLEIPEDSSSSETESISESSSWSKIDKPSEPRAYIELKDWINSDRTLDFQFEKDAYAQSVNRDDVFSTLYAEYVTALYKIIERLGDQNITKIETRQEAVEQIGVISRTSDIGRNTDDDKKAAKISEAFRHIIEHLSHFIEQVKPLVDEEKLESFYDLLSILDGIYANAFYPSIKTKPELLATWVNRYDPKPLDDLVESVMINTPKPYLHPQFWNTYVAELITRGLFEQATEAIANSRFDETESTDEPFFSIIDDFKVLIGEYTNFALKSQFHIWKLKACEFRDDFTKFRTAVTNPEHLLILNQVYDLACIITGLSKTISAYTSNWYDMFAALSLFQVRDDPEVFKDYFDVAIEEKPLTIDDDQTLIEDSIVKLLNGDYLRVLEVMNLIDAPTSATASKLFELKGFLDDYYDASSPKSLHELVNRKTISEYLLVKHAYDCLNNHPLVPVGIGLLLNPCVSTSKQSIASNSQTIGEFLPHYECSTNDDLEWGLTICAKLNLITTARRLYLIYGKKSLKDGHLYEALNMFVNTYDSNAVNEETRAGMKHVHSIVWNMIFQDSLLNNRPIRDELINNIVSNNVDSNFEIHPVIRQCLSPYAVLVSFYKLVGEQGSSDIMKTSLRLIHLLRFTHLPKKFIPLLLAQFLPFLVKSAETLQLPYLIIIVELIDGFESKVSKEDFLKAEELYKHSVNNIESDAEHYDWRVFLKDSKLEVPQDVPQLIKLLRNEVTSNIARVYIGR